MSRAGDGIEYLGVRNGEKWWRARLYWTCPHTGEYRQKRESFSAPTVAAARIERDRRIEEHRKGTVRGKRTRFADAGDEWFATVTAEGTRISWGSHLRALKRVYGDWWLDTFTLHELQRHLDELPGEHENANARRNVLKKVFEWGVRKGYCQENPAELTKRRSSRVDATKALPDAPRKSLAREEIIALLDWLREHDAALYPLVAIQYALGCRFAEVSALEWSEVDLETGLIKIRRGVVRGKQGPPKGRYARRVAIGVAGRELLAEHREHMARVEWPGWDRLVFPGPPMRGGRGGRKSEHWSISTVAEHLRKALAAIGIHDAKAATHLARHSNVTISSEYASDGVLSEVHGHRSAEIRRRYLHAQDAQIIELADHMDRAVLGARARRGEQ